jgi:hypothetical protein
MDERDVQHLLEAFSREFGGDVEDETRFAAGVTAWLQAEHADNLAHPASTASVATKLA